MLGSELLDIFKCLTKQDRRELHDFVRSPFHNKREDVVRLFEYLDTYLKDTPSVFSLKKESKNITTVFKKENVFKAVFVDVQNYDDKQLRYTMSFLLKCIRQFLIYKDLTINDLNNEIALNRALRQRGADKIFEKNIQQSFLFFENQNLRHADFYFYKYRLQMVEYEYLHRRQRGGELHLQEISDSFDDFFMVEILRLACAMKAHQGISQRTYHLSFLEEVLNKIEKGTYKPTSFPKESGFPPSTVFAYYFAYKTLSNNAQSADFQSLKDFIVEKGDIFPQTEIRDLTLVAINFCIKKLNSGEREYEQQALDLYKNGLKTGSFLESGELSSYTYTNVMLLAVKKGEFEWAEQFLQDFKKYLPARERENLFKYNLAMFYFRRNDYPKAMQLLQEVTLKDVLHNLDARRVLMRIYYELGEFDALDSLLESFKIFLHRQKDLSYHRQSYLNLIKFVKKLLQTNLSDKKEKEILRGLIESTTELTERDWLLGQLA
jgi:hypothetical protein